MPSASRRQAHRDRGVGIDPSARLRQNEASHFRRLPSGHFRKSTIAPPPTGTAAVTKVLTLLAAGLATLSLPTSLPAFAGDAAPQNSMFPTPGKSPAMEALAAKRNARCAA